MTDEACLFARLAYLYPGYSLLARWLVGWLLTWLVAWFVLIGFICFTLLSIALLCFALPG